MNKETPNHLLCNEHFKKSKVDYSRLMSDVEDKRLTIGGVIINYILDRPVDEQLEAAVDLLTLVHSAAQQCAFEQQQREAKVVRELKIVKCEEY
jgi:hypothetical protein